MRHISQRIFNGIAVGAALLPEYAQKTVRYALVFLKTDNRRPVSIRHIDAGYFCFDKRGNAQPALARGAIDASITWDNVKKEREQTGAVVGISARIARKKWERENRWLPTLAETAQIHRAVWLKKARPGSSGA